MLDESLHRLQTNHMDLWQIHGVAFKNDPDFFVHKRGAAKARTYAADGRFELYKLSLKFDNPEARLATQNTGHPYPERKQ
jgi:aryl-alcohol dehydrogenase-like predicted oxidoreductase